MANFSIALFLFTFLLFSFSEAREILVGGKSNAWKIPSSQSQSLNQWAETSRFRIGDTLVWTYEEGKDSVLKVTKEDYEACNTENPEQRFEDGKTKVELEKPGPFYFISGAKGHCEQGQKLIVVVLTPRRRFIGISPAPSPAESEGPAVAPSSGAANLKVGFLAVVVGILGVGVGLV
ncbi:early nodulin-like protein 1 [Cucumis melo var. makuwa]|uniref:Early nodulin-like protein 1 n=1 Tax=Cucumis melo var. makuwa TaxID=1194695 RepID=A0A5A7VC90_CUCMM|nr:early nodulin-like protein 1 [Cucumis melo var. makuwa]